RRDFGEHVVEGTGKFLAARVGHDAKRTVFAATFHDRYEGAGPGHRGLRPPGGGNAVEQFADAVQRLGTEHQIDVGSAIDDRFSLLTRHAAAHSYHNPRARVLERTPTAELAEDLLLRLFTDGTGIEQQQIGLRGIFGALETVRRGEHIGHARRVVLVHLATERLDVELARHRKRSEQ